MIVSSYETERIQYIEFSFRHTFLESEKFYKCQIRIPRMFYPYRDYFQKKISKNFSYGWPPFLSTTPRPYCVLTPKYFTTFKICIKSQISNRPSFCGHTNIPNNGIIHRHLAKKKSRHKSQEHRTTQSRKIRSKTPNKIGQPCGKTFGITYSFKESQT
jgi:hypothetical protein